MISGEKGREAVEVHHILVGNLVRYHGENECNGGRECHAESGVQGRGNLEGRGALDNEERGKETRTKEERRENNGKRRWRFNPKVTMDGVQEDRSMD